MSYIKKLKNTPVPFTPMPRTPPKVARTQTVKATMYGIRLCESQRYLTQYRLWQSPYEPNLRSMMLFPSIEQAEKEIAWFKSHNWQEWMETFEVMITFSTKQKD